MKPITLAVLVAALFSSNAIANPYGSNDRRVIYSEISSCLANSIAGVSMAKMRGDLDQEAKALVYVSRFLSYVDRNGLDREIVDKMVADKIDKGRYGIRNLEVYSGTLNLGMEQAYGINVGYCIANGY